MALTWGRKKKGRVRHADPRSRVDALAARRVLRDAYRARRDLAEAFHLGERADCRLRWITAITLLRAVGHALENIDTRRSSEILAASKAAWDRWRTYRFDHLIFHEFIKKERDVLLKEYRFAISAPAGKDMLNDTEANEADWSSLLLIGDKTYSAVEAVDAAIAWWETELERIEIESEDARHHSTQRAATRGPREDRRA